MKKGLLIKITILLAGYGMFSDVIVVPIVTAIFTEFPNSNTFIQNFVITGPALIAIPTLLIAGKLAQYFSKKDLLMFSFIVYLIGGIGGAFVNSIELLAITRAISGAAVGLIGVLALSLIPEIYTDIAERGQVIGLYNAVSAVFGVIMSILSGVIALTSGWRNSFFLNSLAFISLALIVFFLPRTPPEGKLIKQEEVIQGNSNYSYKSIIAIIIAVFYYTAPTCAIYYCIDIYVVEKALGTSALSGTITAGMTLGTFLTSLAFGIIYMKLRRLMPPVFFIVTGVCFIILTYTTSPLIVLIACILVGGFSALSASYYPMVISEIVPESKLSIIMSFYMITLNISFFLSTYVPIVIQRIFRVESTADSLIYIGILLGIGGVVSLILAFKSKKTALFKF